MGGKGSMFIRRLWTSINQGGLGYPHRLLSFGLAFTVLFALGINPAYSLTVQDLKNRLESTEKGQEGILKNLEDARAKVSDAKIKVNSLKVSDPNYSLAHDKLNQAQSALKEAEASTKTLKGMVADAVRRAIANDDNKLQKSVVNQEEINQLGVVNGDMSTAIQLASDVLKLADNKAATDATKSYPPIQPNSSEATPQPSPQTTTVTTVAVPVILPSSINPDHPLPITPVQTQADDDPPWLLIILFASLVAALLGWLYRLEKNKTETDDMFSSVKHKSYELKQRLDNLIEDFTAEKQKRKMLEEEIASLKASYKLLEENQFKITGTTTGLSGMMLTPVDALPPEKPKEVFITPDHSPTVITLILEEITHYNASVTPTKELFELIQEKLRQNFPGMTMGECQAYDFSLKRVPDDQKWFYLLFVFPHADKAEPQRGLLFVAPGINLSSKVLNYFEGGTPSQNITALKKPAWVSLNQGQSSLILEEKGLVE
ncbi:MAG: hypothetical protein NTX45_10920 [Proteobacteria bacterium]|nr:hypothetical protein [Pseudomonadota bacterium]